MLRRVVPYMVTLPEKCLWERIRLWKGERKQSQTRERKVEMQSRRLLLLLVPWLGKGLEAHPKQNSHLTAESKVACQTPRCGFTEMLLQK